MSAPKWSVGMRRIGPGMYEDADGAIHVKAEEICVHLRVPPTRANIEMAERTAREALGNAFPAVDKKFLGGCFVRAPGMAHAMQRTHDLGINPGGEVAGWEIPEEEGVPPFPLDKLLTKEQMGGGATLGELEAASGNAYQS